MLLTGGARIRRIRSPRRAGPWPLGAAAVCLRIAECRNAAKDLEDEFPGQA
jgi:hypothetical protein